MRASARLKSLYARTTGIDTRMDTQPPNQSGTAQGNYMYAPPFDSLLQSIGTTRAEFEHASVVEIPTELFKLLLQVTVASGDFNEVGYLRDNPDIAAAVRSGKVEDARLHYVGFGYFEGRTGATPEVDEALVPAYLSGRYRRGQNQGCCFSRRAF